MIRKYLFFVLFGALLVGGLGLSQSSFADFSFSDEFGTQGDNDDEFDTPTDLVISKDGSKMYVVDSENNRISIFELTGGSNCPSGTDEVVNDEVCFDETFGSEGSASGRFDIPTDLTIDKNNDDIYVVDSDNNRIQKFDSSGDFDNLEFGSSDSGDDEYLGNPTAIAIHKASDYIYVADSDTDSISVFDDNGNYKFKFEDDGSNDDFKNPSGMVIDDKDDILYVADTGNNRIRIYELTDGGNCPSGTDEVDNDEEVCFVDDFGSSGSDEGKFDEPSGLAFDEDNSLLYVADTDNNRIQTFEIVSGNTCPTGTDEIINGICFVEEFGSSGSDDGEFNSPSGLALDIENSKLYVADTDNDRIQILNLSEGSSSDSGSSSSNDVPDKPTNLVASPVSLTAVFLTWETPDDDTITGYKIDYRVGSGNYSTLIGNTQSTATNFIHDGLDDGERYYYKVYAINSDGTSIASSSVSAEPDKTLAPSGLTATAISSSQIKLEWFPPTETFGGSITNYTIEREVIAGIYDDKTYDSGKKTEYILSNLQTDKTYTYVVSATFSVGGSPRSDTASATPQEDSKAPSSSSYITIPDEVRSLKADTTSSEVKLSWSVPSDNGGSSIIGYKIEVKEENRNSFTVLEDKTTSTSYTHDNVKIDTEYTYRIYAINSVGTSSSVEVSTTPTEINLEISPLGKFNIDEQKNLSFTVKTTDNSIDDVKFSLKNAPSGTTINSDTGAFTWTPSSSQGTNTYTFDIIASVGSEQDTQSVTITVNNVTEKEPEPKQTTPEPKETTPEPLAIPASFVDETKDPQSYIDRYNNEASYKKWFDDNYSEYDSIEQAVGLEQEEEVEELVIPASFVDETKDPQSYIDRYNNEASYKKWFDDNYSEYDSIEQAVGLDNPDKVEESKVGQCGLGTELVNGKCKAVKEGGGCLIATATFGSEMAPQVQLLREIRDNQLMGTGSGISFMTGFNQLYYSFSPIIADYERENPAFKEMVKIGITPLLASLSIMSHAESEGEVLGYGIGVILMNLGMYIGIPAVIIYKARKVKF